MLIATIEHLDVVTTTAAVDLVVVPKRVATQAVGATLQVHLGEMDIDSLPFWGADANTAVEVISTAEQTSWTGG